MIPTYEKIMLPFLKHLADGQVHGLVDIHDTLTNQFELTDEELRELLPSGLQPIFRNRVSWAGTYLKKAGLVISPKRAHFKISDKGLELLKENPPEITANSLMRYDDFLKFKTRKIEKAIPSKFELMEDSTDQTPEESLALKQANTVCFLNVGRAYFFGAADSCPPVAA